MRHEYISESLNNYNKTKNGPKFTILDALILDTVMSNAYTTDLILSRWFMCSESTIKRSINKLCNFGLIAKHISQNNTKNLTVQEEALNSFIVKYSHEVGAQ